MRHWSCFQQGKPRQRVEVTQASTYTSGCIEKTQKQAAYRVGFQWCGVFVEVFHVIAHICMNDNNEHAIYRKILQARQKPHMYAQAINAKGALPKAIEVIMNPPSRHNLRRPAVSPTPEARGRYTPTETTY